MAASATGPELPHGKLHEYPAPHNRPHEQNHSDRGNRHTCSVTPVRRKIHEIRCIAVLHPACLRLCAAGACAGTGRERHPGTGDHPWRHPRRHPRTDDGADERNYDRTYEGTYHRTYQGTHPADKGTDKGAYPESGPKVGWITIISTPSGALVSLDGKTVGLTPIAGTEVGAGIAHSVRITMDGYEPYETSISVGAGEQASTDATLKAKVTPTEQPTPTPIVTQGPIGGGKGWIRINANVDGATASLGDLSSGCTISGGSCAILVGTTTTPVKTFTVQKPGYTIYTGQITEWPREGATVDVYATLNPTPATGSVQVSSYPTGAVATLDGGAWQYTTATFPAITAGTNHNVEISMSGYQTYTTTVYVTAGQTAYVSTSLVPVNPQPSTGSLRVTTSPSGADIYIDGRYMAASPNVITNLAPGTHTLRMQKAG